MTPIVIELDNDVVDARASAVVQSALVRGNTLVVDAINGNDSTGTATGSKPYLTLAAAKAAAGSGDVIRVLPGAYSESATLAKNGVNWQFDAGAVVTFTTGVSAFSDGGSAVAFSVGGYGEFVCDSASCIESTNSATSIEVVCRKIRSTVSGEFGTVVASDGTIRVDAFEISNQQYDCILTLDDSGDPTIIVRCVNLIPGVFGDAIECNDGLIVADIDVVHPTVNDTGIWASGGRIIGSARYVMTPNAIVEDGGTVDFFVVSNPSLGTLVQPYDADLVAKDVANTWSGIQTFNTQVNIVTGTDTQGLRIYNPASTLDRVANVLMGYPGYFDDQLLIQHNGTPAIGVTDSTVRLLRTTRLSGSERSIEHEDNLNNAVVFRSSGSPGIRISALTQMIVGINFTTQLTLTSSSLTVAPNVTLSALCFLGVYTVGTLPSAASNAGALAQVTDSNSTTNGNTVAGGGSSRVPVFSNGTNWIIK